MAYGQELSSYGAQDSERRLTFSIQTKDVGAFLRRGWFLYGNLETSGIELRFREDGWGRLMVSWRTFVKRLRFLLGVTQAHFAENLGVDQGTVSRWERGLVTPELGIQRRLRDMMRTVQPAINARSIERMPVIAGIMHLADMGIISSISFVAAVAYQRSPAEMRELAMFDLLSESTQELVTHLNALPDWRRGEIADFEATIQRIDGRWARGIGTPIGDTGHVFWTAATIEPPDDLEDNIYKLILRSFDEICD